MFANESLGDGPFNTRAELDRGRHSEAEGRAAREERRNDALANGCNIMAVWLRLMK